MVAITKSGDLSTVVGSHVDAVLQGGRDVRDLASDLGIATATIYRWQRQARIDAGDIVGINSAIAPELADAKRRIRDLEEELTATKLAASALKNFGYSLVARFPVFQTLTGQGISITTACRVLRVTDRGYLAWRGRPMSRRTIRHEMLAETITNIHRASRDCYGVRRVHAELVRGLGIHVGRDQVAQVISRTGLWSVSGT